MKVGVSPLLVAEGNADRTRTLHRVFDEALGIA
jgi:hypothetical protein